MIPRRSWVARSRCFWALGAFLTQIPPASAQTDSLRLHVTWAASPAPPVPDGYDLRLLLRTDTILKINGVAGACCTHVITVARPVVTPGDSLGPYRVVVGAWNRQPGTVPLRYRWTWSVPSDPRWIKGQDIVPRAPGQPRVDTIPPLSARVDTVWFGQFATGADMDSIACVSPPPLVPGQRWSRGTHGPGFCINATGLRVGRPVQVPFLVHAGDTLRRVDLLGRYASRAQPGASRIDSVLVPAARLTVSPPVATLPLVP